MVTRFVECGILIRTEDKEQVGQRLGEGGGGGQRQQAVTVYTATEAKSTDLRRRGGLGEVKKGFRKEISDIGDKDGHHIKTASGGYELWFVVM